MKNVAEKSSLLGKFQKTIWNFPDSELQKAQFMHFTTYVAINMRNYFKLHYIILIFFLDCFIVSYLRFFILAWWASKIYDRYMWMRAHSQSGWRFVVWDLAGCELLRRIWCHQFCCLSWIFLEITFIDCI